MLVGEDKLMEEQGNTKNWRKIVLRTDGFRWILDSKETNSSMLEIIEIARHIIHKFGYENNG